MAQIAKEKTVVKLNPLESSFFIYGAPKIGKSTLASYMDDPYFIAPERGLDYLEVYRSDVANWSEFKATVGLLLMEKHPYKTIIVDTADEAFAMCAKYIYAKEKFNHMAELDGGRGYDYVKNEFAETIQKLTVSRFGVVFLAHEKLVKSTFQGIEKSRYWPNIMKTGRDVLLPKIDHIGRLFTKAVTVEGKRLQQRHVSFCNSADWEAGSRKLSGFGDICVEPEADCWKNIRSLFGT